MIVLKNCIIHEVESMFHICFFMQFSCSLTLTQPSSSARSYSSVSIVGPLMWEINNLYALTGVIINRSLSKVPPI